MTIYAVVTSGGTVGAISQFDSTSVILGQPIQFIKNASSVPSSFEGTFSTWTQVWTVVAENFVGEGVIDEIGGVLIYGSGQIRALADGTLIQSIVSGQPAFGPKTSSIRSVYTVIPVSGNQTGARAFTVIKNGSAIFTSPDVGFGFGPAVIGFSGKYIALLDAGLAGFPRHIQLWVGA